MKQATKSYFGLLFLIVNTLSNFDVIMKQATQSYFGMLFLIVNTLRNFDV